MRGRPIVSLVAAVIAVVGCSATRTAGPPPLVAEATAPATVSAPVATPDLATTAPPSTGAAPAATTLPPTTVAPAPATTNPPAGPSRRGPLPEVDAAAYAVFDPATGELLAGREADTPHAVGSLMKLLTAYVVMDAGHLGRVVTVPRQRLVSVEESAIGLYAGEQLPRDVLLRAMLIVSANDAARALAVDVAGSEESFAERMTAAADDLGLTGTRAANATGLDAEGQHSTARDMAALGAVLMRDDDFAAAVARTEAYLHDEAFPATNDLLMSYDGADGIKTGHTTQAGWCLLASATRDGRRMIVAVLGAPSDAARDAAASRLLDWAFG